MGGVRETTLEEQHAIILKKIATAEGAFKATGFLVKIGGSLCGVLVLLVSAIAAYSFNKIEANSETANSNKQAIAIIKSKEIDYNRWRHDVDSKLERVVYKK